MASFRLGDSSQLTKSPSTPSPGACPNPVSTDEFSLNPLWPGPAFSSLQKGFHPGQDRLRSHGRVPLLISLELPARSAEPPADSTASALKAWLLPGCHPPLSFLGHSVSVRAFLVSTASFSFPLNVGMCQDSVLRPLPPFKFGRYTHLSPKIPSSTCLHTAPTFRSLHTTVPPAPGTPLGVPTGCLVGSQAPDASS